MSWLTPLGLLGLLGLIVWLIIYIIKPNFQRKIISTTYVWKRSLKFRKKRIPMNKLRSILLIICQILTISALSAALAQPFIAAAEEEKNEKIIILDASADMLTALEDGTNTRFDRAVTQIHEYVDQVIAEGGRVSVILATNTPEFIVQRAGEEFKGAVHEKLDMLIDPNDYRCTYGVANMEEAMKLAETVLLENPKAEVVLYTGTTYTDPGKVTVVDVSDMNEWNCAILGAKAVIVENFYEFTIDLACYGRDSAINLYMDVYGVNGGGTRSFNESVLYTQEMGSVTLTFGNDQARADTEDNYILADIYSYEYAYIRVGHDDSLQCDNNMYLYGGTKPELKIQYYSSLPNPFYSGVLRALGDTVDSDWDIHVKEVRNPDVPEDSGYDVYIYEHTMPEKLPTDGLVLLVNPDQAPNGSGFYLGNRFASQSELFLEGGEEQHPLMDGLDVSNISVTMFTKINNYSGDFVPVMYCQGYPIMLASTSKEYKMVVMAFSLNYSNLPLVKEFPTMILNMLNYYVPSTVQDHLYEVDDIVTLNARGPELMIEGPENLKLTMKNFPGTMHVTVPGSYTMTQTALSGEYVVENIYVKIPAVESNIRLVEDVLENPEIEYVEEDMDKDLVFYCALILVVLLFCEWLLQLKEYF